MYDFVEYVSLVRSSLSKSNSVSSMVSILNWCWTPLSLKRQTFCNWPRDDLMAKVHLKEVPFSVIMTFNFELHEHSTFSNALVKI